MQDAALATILLGTVLALYLRPFDAHDWHIAAAGACAAWVIGPISFRHGIETLADSANIIAFFAGLMLIAAGAEAAGLYSRAANMLSQRESVRGRTALVLALGFVITAVLSNDATPLVLTPAILAAGAGRPASVRWPAFGATFIADGASLLLPVSNPVNLLFYERFDLSFSRYLTVISLPALVGAVALGAVTLALTPGGNPDTMPAPTPPPVPQPGRAWPSLMVVAALAVTYIAAGIAEFPLGAVTVAGGLAMFGAARLQGPVDLSRYRKHASPGVLVFVASLLLLVENVEAAGLLGGIGEALDATAGAPAPVTLLSAALLAAVLANLLNNWPSALLLTAAIASAGGDSDALVAGALIGSTIGANFTMVGSLSTVFWLSLNRQGGVTVSPAQYARAAFLPTLAGVLVACLLASALV